MSDDNNDLAYTLGALIARLLHLAFHLAALYLLWRIVKAIEHLA